MAVLNAADRQKVKDQLSRSFAWSGLTKPDIAAAVNAIDDFLEANATAINNAFPAPFKTTATAAQKAIIVGYVAFRRAGLLNVEGE